MAVLKIFSHTIYLYNKKFDWCFMVDPIWLVWHTYISHWSSHWSTHWTAYNIPDAPTKRYFFYKKITQKRYDILTCEDMISSHVKILMFSLISSLSLKLYLNSLLHHRNIFGSSSKVFGNLRTSSEIFGNSRKMFGNVRLAVGTILENLGKSSESQQKRRHQYVNRDLKHQQRNGTTTTGGSKIFPREGSAHVRFCQNVV